MRITIVLMLVLLVSAFAVAQDTTNPSAAPGAQPQTQSQQPGSMPSQQPGTMPGQAAPSNPSMDRAPVAGDVVEGCLGGTNPHYTLTDSKGTTYQILIPEGADASPLAKHIGESVQVEGTVDKSGSSASSASSDSSASSSTKSGTGGQSSIHAMRIARGTSSCPGAGPSAAKPPSK